jgi:hypothetical protein
MLNLLLPSDVPSLLCVKKSLPPAAALAKVEKDEPPVVREEPPKEDDGAAGALSEVGDLAALPNEGLEKDGEALAAALDVPKRETPAPKVFGTVEVGVLLGDWNLKDT